jgi:hypothetical protein
MLFIAASNAQSEVSLIIRDSSNGVPIPFAHISVINRSFGTISNEAGWVFLKNTNEADSIHVYTIGYHDKKIPIENIYNKTVCLLPKIYDLPEVVVSVAAKPKAGKKKFKKYKHRLHNFYGAGHEIVRYFSAPVRGATIASVSVFIPESIKEDEKIRLLIYQMGASDNPGESLMPKSVILSCGKKSNWVTIDIRDLRISAPEAGFFAGIEFLENKQTQREKISVGLSEDSDANTTWIKNVGQFWHQLDFLKSPKNKQLNLMAVVEYL